MSLWVTISARIDATVQEFEQGCMDVTCSSRDSIVRWELHVFGASRGSRPQPALDRTLGDLADPFLHACLIWMIGCFELVRPTRSSAVEQVILCDGSLVLRLSPNVPKQGTDLVRSAPLRWR